LACWSRHRTGKHRSNRTRNVEGRRHVLTLNARTTYKQRNRARRKNGGEARKGGTEQNGSRTRMNRSEGAMQPIAIRHHLLERFLHSFRSRLVDSQALASKVGRMPFEFAARREMIPFLHRILCLDLVLCCFLFHSERRNGWQDGQRRERSISGRPDRILQDTHGTHPSV